MTFDALRAECMCATVAGLKLACLWGKPQKRFLLDVSEDVLRSFCLARVTFEHIRCVSRGMCVGDHRWTEVGVVRQFFGELKVLL